MNCEVFDERSRERRTWRVLSESVKMTELGMSLSIATFIECRIASASAEKIDAKDETRYLSDKSRGGQYIAKPT